jgi:F420-non-reducing hydrogenase iron-sulfur subunit
VRIIRMNCSARFDPFHILWAFLNGADGVFLGACPPGECHYGSGNLYARERVEVLQNLLAQHGVDPVRLHLEFMGVDEGQKFAGSLTQFVKRVGELNVQDRQPVS